MIDSIINWLLNVKKDTYSDGYGIYDIETGLMYDYFVPVSDMDISQKKQYLIDTLDIKDHTANVMLGLPDESVQESLHDNFAENIAKEMEAKRKNDEFKKTVFFGDKTQFEILEEKAEAKKLAKFERKINKNIEFIVSHVHFRGIDWADISISDTVQERDFLGLFEIKNTRISISDSRLNGMQTICRIDILDTDLRQCKLIIDSIKPGDIIRKLRYGR